MAISFKTRLCDQCAGKLKYIKERKLWQCMYCGAEVERQESYDGLFTIKNVVRQTLLDCSYRRLESASKNLVECEKIDSRYVGTLIARLTYQMISAITPGALSDQEMRGIFSQISKSYEQLNAAGEGISDEEEALYEFLEEADAFATLLLVYDSLGDAGRRDMMVEWLQPEEVYSVEANNNLLAYALKTNDTDLADKVIKNNANLDVRYAFGEVLAKYPDSDQKGENLSTLIGTGMLKADDREAVESYISTTEDSVNTTAGIVMSSLSSGLRLSLSIIIERLLQRADAETVSSVLSEFCKNKMSDDEEYAILGFAYTCKSREIAAAALDCLKNCGQYIMIPQRMVISMLSDKEINREGRLWLFERAFDFRLDQKGVESVITNFLCYDTSSPEDRLPIIEAILERCEHIPTATVENYVIRCTTDGENKPRVVEMIFDNRLNMSFFNDLVSKYTSSSADSEEIKRAVLDILTGKGLKMDPLALNDYISSSTAPVEEKIEFIKKTVRGGSQLRSDAANEYLEKTDPESFSSELFSLIVTPASTFSEKALENYILRCGEREAIKADNIRTLIEMSPGVAEGMRCNIVHLTNSINCNLLQAYVLTTSDSEQVAFAVCEYLASRVRIKLNEEMSVFGTYMRFKKYASANRERLSSITEAICEKHKVYSLFF
ncbi:MAG: hypothetical protein IJD22_04805 [Clostridia bacterium]|nr:hypothetical protein [Clostridia bacterium]